MPAYFPPPSIVIDLSMVTRPKAPDSCATISPPALVFASAPAKVRHGLAAVQLLLSSPEGDTQLRLTCPCATPTASKQAAAANTIENRLEIFRGFMFVSPLVNQMKSSDRRASSS